MNNSPEKIDLLSDDENVNGHNKVWDKQSYASVAALSVASSSSNLTPLRLAGTQSRDPRQHERNKERTTPYAQKAPGKNLLGGLSGIFGKAARPTIFSTPPRGKKADDVLTGAPLAPPGI